MMLSEAVSIARRFRRSIRLDTDIGTQDALSGFICHGSGANVLGTMAQLICESGQRAFIWTGPRCRPVARANIASPSPMV